LVAPLEILGQMIVPEEGKGYIREPLAIKGRIWEGLWKGKLKREHVTGRSDAAGNEGKKTPNVPTIPARKRHPNGKGVTGPTPKKREERSLPPSPHGNRTRKDRQGKRERVQEKKIRGRRARGEKPVMLAGLFLVAGEKTAGGKSPPGSQKGLPGRKRDLPGEQRERSPSLRENLRPEERTQQQKSKTQGGNQVFGKVAERITNGKRVHLSVQTPPGLAPS